MKNLFKIFLLVFCLNAINTIFAQQTVGVFVNTDDVHEGYTLFAPVSSKITYLINNCGEKVHSWTSLYEPGLSCYLMKNGVLLRTGKVPGTGGSSGIVEMIDWDGTVIWDHSIDPSLGRQHHDIELLNNGNILLIVSDKKSTAEVTQAGGTTSNSTLTSETILEVQPNLTSGGGTVVWKWDAWDHLIQDSDNGKDNFGVVSDNPGKIDINFLVHNATDWLHFNGIDYNEKFKQIIVSCRGHSELWVLDHTTDSTQAADTIGGTFGQGGEILYRWGNPQAYGKGGSSEQQLFFQHDTHWIPDSLKDGGKIIMFNNQAGNPESKNYSTINIINPPVDSNGFYTYIGSAFSPTTSDWEYKAADETSFYSKIISGVQRLEDGNTLICEGVGGRFFEIDSLKNITWEYINPVDESGPVTQNDIIASNNAFRCTKYSNDYAGLEGKTLTSLGPIELGETYSCDSTSDTTKIGLNEFDNEKLIKVYPIPSNDVLHVSLLDNNIKGELTLTLVDMKGSLILTTVTNTSDKNISLDLNNLKSGVYNLTLKTTDNFWRRKVVIQK